MVAPEELRNAIETWSDLLIEGYQDILTTAAQATTDQQKAAACTMLAQVCQETLDERQKTRAHPFSS